MSDRVCKKCGVSIDGMHHSAMYCRDCKGKKQDVIGDSIKARIDQGRSHAEIMQYLAVVVTRMMELR